MYIKLKGKKFCKVKTYGLKGYSLLECIIALSLTAIVLSLAFSIYLYGYKYYSIAESNIEVEQNIRYAFERIFKTIRMTNNPQEQVYVSNNNLYCGEYRYYMSNGILFERKGGGTNHLAVNITRFEPVIEGDMLIITLAGTKEGMDTKVEITSKIYIGDNLD